MVSGKEESREPMGRVMGWFCMTPADRPIIDICAVNARRIEVNRLWNVMLFYIIRNFFIDTRIIKFS